LFSLKNFTVPIGMMLSFLGAGARTSNS